MPNYDASTDPFGIDLRQEFAAIMRDHGSWGVLRKRVTRTRVSSYRPEPGEITPKTRQALVPGEAYFDYLVRYRRTTLFDVPEKEDSIGREGQALARFYLQWDKKPDTHDFIIELAQDPTSQNRSFQVQPVTPLEIVKIWDIQEVTPMRDRGGRIEFWQVLCKESVTGGPA